jgi:hypothetical protein
MRRSISHAKALRREDQRGGEGETGRVGDELMDEFSPSPTLPLSHSFALSDFE